jgi:pimeloyl-ACP methyl ester carboxylesterase
MDLVESSSAADPASAEAPAWFADAVAQLPGLGGADVDGTRIAWRTWGTSRAGHHDVLLVHGGGAHARWWDHLAPFLAAGRRVIAVDLAGHGDSGHRDSYSLEAWADDLAAMLGPAGFDRPPVVVGHSLGGLAAAVLARRGTPELAGLVVIDSPITPEGPISRAEADNPSFGRIRVYPTREEAMARFRPVPPQAMLPYIAQYIAEASVQPVEGGWSWKFDPRFVAPIGTAPRTLDGLPCRAVFVAGGRGILSARGREAMDASAEVSVVEIPGAGHAMMLDAPLELLAALRGILAGWDTADRR